MTTARPAATAGSTSCLAATATSASSAIGASSRTSARMTTTAVSTASALTSAPLRSPRSSAIVSRGDSDPSARKVSSHSAFYGEIIEDSSSFKYLGFFFHSFSLIIDFKAIFFSLGALCILQLLWSPTEVRSTWEPTTKGNLVISCPCTGRSCEQSKKLRSCSSTKAPRTSLWAGGHRMRPRRASSSLTSTGL